MSMVYCRGCGKEIHETALMCPHCGYNYPRGAGGPAAFGAPSVGFVDAVSNCFANYATFQGVASRPEYWYFFLFNIVVSIVTALVDSNSGGHAAADISSLALLIPNVAVAARRLHDIGRSGWWQLLSLTGIGVLVLIYWFCQPGKTVGNQYNPSVRGFAA